MHDLVHLLYAAEQEGRFDLDYRRVRKHRARVDTKAFGGRHALPGRAAFPGQGRGAQAARQQQRFSFAPLLGASLQNVIEQHYVNGDSDRSRHFYICGVGQIVPQLRDLLRSAGYERRAVQYEKW